MRESDIKEVAAAFVDGMDDLQRDVERRFDAFLLDPGMGPMTYLTADGRVLLDRRTWDGDDVVEADDDEAISSLVVGAEKTGISALLTLIPPPVDGATTCPHCGGRRRAALGPIRELICVLCRGRGWATIEMIEAAKARGILTT